jgi:predicted AAA+ superfamily ATPase
MEGIVMELNEQYPVILLTGPRQVGKTTMLQTLMRGAERRYVSLDDLTNRSLARTDPAMFFQLHRPPVLVDEVQYAPELFTEIKIIADRDRKAGAFWLTGSQIFKLMRGVRESLAGRVALLELSSCSQNEILRRGKNVPFTTDFRALVERQNESPATDVSTIFRRIHRGSMPALVSGQYRDNSIFYSGYLNTYLERDIHDLSGDIDSVRFLRFITSAACRCAQMLNVSDIAQDADLSQSTVKNWLNILEALGVIFYLHPYSNNTLKRTVKTPKLYFFDCGLVAWLARWSSPETLESGAMSGPILENYVVGEIIKSCVNAAKPPFLYYYRDKDRREIDLILEADGQLSPIEIKKTASPDRRLINVFKTLDRSDKKRGSGAVLCMAPALSAIDAENYVVPIGLL